jgi:anaerobic magnesium-protoporphyrin IX monomethyl ester cyclase
MARLAFIQRNPNENLGVMILIACLKRSGHEAGCFIAAEESDVVEAVREYAPDIIGFTTISGMHRWCIETARKLKTADNLIVLGGPHPTFFPEVIQEDGVDIVCIGEGEEAIVELADRFPDLDAIGGIRNLHVKIRDSVIRNDPRDLIRDLDELPFPDRESYYRYRALRMNSRKTVLSSRGCPYACSFCFNSSYRRLYAHKGKTVRFRSPGNMIQEILEIQRRYRLESVFFQDDTFVLQTDWLFPFLSDYRKKVGLPFTCLVRADLVTEEIVRALKCAGCVCVQFGVESGNEHIRNRILGKGIADAQIIETGRLLRKHKIRFKTYNMLRIPHETIENAFETVGINWHVKADFPWAAILHPYPKTEVAEYMTEQRLLPSDYGVDDLPLSFFNLVCPAREDWPFINLQRLFFYAVKFPAALPLIKRMIRLRPNPLFDALFLLSHAYSYKGSENMSTLDAIRFGIKALGTSFK